MMTASEALSPEALSPETLALPADNPFAAIWKTPFGLPPFAAIKPEHIFPAFEAALAKNRSEIAAIVADPAAPSFANTIEALERAGKALSRVGGVFYNLSGADTNDALQAIDRDLSPLTSRHWSAIMMDPDLFARVDAVHARRDQLGLDAEQMRLLERTHRGFIRSGAQLGPEQKKRLAAINERLSGLGIRFGQNVLKDESSYALIVEDKAEGGAGLAGLPAFLIAAMARAATDRGHPGKHAVTLSRSIIEPFLTFSTRRDLREEAFIAWSRRGENGGETDNRAIVAEMVKLRAEKARLLGFATFAHFKLDDSMAKTPENVRDLLELVWKPAKARAAREAADLAALAQAEGENSAIRPWDWRHYAEKVRQQTYALDEAVLKPYLQLDRIIQAAFDVAGKLFGLTFEARPELKAYHPDVRIWEVREKSGRHIGLFLGDYFARASKRSGAWMSAYRSQRNFEGEVRPIIVNVCNFAKPAEGKPALLSIDDARTLFHEFGHALHGLLSDVRYGSLAGTSVSRDFVELPSQLYEHWFLTREVMQEYCLHAETGEAIPDVLIDKIKRAQTFNQGFATVEYTSSALVDLAFHSLENAEEIDPLAFEAAELKRLGMPAEIIMRHRTPHFTHVFSGDGYSAGYYSYLWSEVMDADAFNAFLEAGDVFAPEIAAKLKRFIYSAGDTRDAAEAYELFRGRLPTPDALLEKRGLSA
jgi:peptidyl-dipeptidase Dcp